MELERLEAVLASWEGRKISVRAPLTGTAFLTFYGELKCQLDSECNPQFLIIGSSPSPALVFYIKDVAIINPTNNMVDLKKAVDQNQVVE